MSFLLSTIIPFDTEDRKLIFSKGVSHRNLKWKLASRLLRDSSNKPTDVEVHIECSSISGEPFATCAQFTFNNAYTLSFPELTSSGKRQSSTIRFKIKERETMSSDYFVSANVTIMPQNALGVPMSLPMPMPPATRAPIQLTSSGELPRPPGTWKRDPYPLNPTYIRPAAVPQLNALRIEELEKNVVLLKQSKMACDERCLELQETVKKLDERLQATDAKVALLEKPAKKAPEPNPLDQKYTDAHQQSQICLLTAALTLSNERKAGTEKALQKIGLDKKNLSQTITVLEEQSAKMKIFKASFSDYLKSSDKCIADQNSYNKCLKDSLEAVNIENQEIKKQLQIENAELTRAVAARNAKLEKTVLVYDEERKEAERKFVEMEAKWRDQVDKLEKELKEKDAKILDLTHRKDGDMAGINGMQMPQQSATPPAKNEVSAIKAVPPTPTSASVTAQHQQTLGGSSESTSATAELSASVSKQVGDTHTQTGDNVGQPQVDTTMPSTPNTPAPSIKSATLALLSTLNNAQIAKITQGLIAQKQASQQLQPQQQAAQLLPSTIIPKATTTQSADSANQHARLKQLHLLQQQQQQLQLLAALCVNPKTNNQKLTDMISEAAKLLQQQQKSVDEMKKKKSNQ